MTFRTPVVIACGLVLATAVGLPAQQKRVLPVQKDVGVTVYPGANFDPALSKMMAEMTQQSASTMRTLPPGTVAGMFTTSDDIVKVAKFYRGLFPGETMEVETKRGEEARKTLLDGMARLPNATYKANLKALAPKVKETHTAFAMATSKGNMGTVALTSPIIDVVNGRVVPGTEIWIMSMPHPSMPHPK